MFFLFITYILVLIVLKVLSVRVNLNTFRLSLSSNIPVKEYCSTPVITMQETVARNPLAPGEPPQNYVQAVSKFVVST